MEIVNMRAIIFVMLCIQTIGFSKPQTPDENLKLLDKCTIDAKEELIEKKQFTGRLDYFVWGDLFHSVVQGANGEVEDFSSGYDDSCFLAQHKNELVTIEYDLMCQSIPGYNQYVPANVITQIKAKNSDLTSWKKHNDGHSKKCENLVEKYTQQQ